MSRDLDKAALHATFDMVLRALSSKEGAAPGAPAGPKPREDALVTAYQGAKRKVRDLATRDPMDSLVTVVGVGTVLFYLAEKGKNDKCNTIWDALTFITTCLSVGYDDVFAKTSSGKAIASFVMTVGPQLSGSLFDPPRSEAEREAEGQAALQRAVVARLDSILDALRSPPATAGRI
ncbi:MAG: ion channel [Polyangiaceae bacterium]